MIIPDLVQFVKYYQFSTVPLIWSLIFDLVSFSYCTDDPLPLLSENKVYSSFNSTKNICENQSLNGITLMLTQNIIMLQNSAIS